MNSKWELLHMGALLRKKILTGLSVFSVSCNILWQLPWRSSFLFPVDSNLLHTWEESEWVAEQLQPPPQPNVCRCILMYLCKAADPRVQPKLQSSWQHTPVRNLELFVGDNCKLQNCLFLLFQINKDMSSSVPGIPVFQCVYFTTLPLVHTNSSMFCWFDSPNQKCFSGLKPTKLTRNALSTLEICKHIHKAVAVPIHVHEMYRAGVTQSVTASTVK